MPTLYRERQLGAVLFDLDGTLVRTFIDFPAMRSAIREHAASLGESIYRAVADSQDTLEIVAQAGQILRSQGREDLAASFETILQQYEEIGCANPERIEGASELLTELGHQGVRIGIVTRNCRRISTQVMERMNLSADQLIAREDTQTFKPHPEPLLLACRHLGVSPEESAMVGDMWTDIAAGNAANVALTIGIQWDSDPPGRFQRSTPDYEVTSLVDAGLTLKRCIAQQ